jgi:hypothetical protein
MWDEAKYRWREAVAWAILKLSRLLDPTEVWPVWTGKIGRPSGLGRSTGVGDETKCNAEFAGCRIFLYDSRNV